MAKRISIYVSLATKYGSGDDAVEVEMTAPTNDIEEIVRVVERVAPALIRRAATDLWFSTVEAPRA